MSEPTEDICDALVTYINGLRDETPNPLSLTCQADKPEDPEKELTREHDGLQVFLIPYGETEQKIGRGGEVLETFTVTLLVARKLTNEFTRSRLMQFVRELRAQLRGVSMATYRYSVSEVVSKFDPERLNKSGLFYSAVRVTYLGTN